MGIAQTALAVLLALAAAVVVYGVLLYNGLVMLRNNVRRAWANIDVLLKQRHDELPRLVDVCRQYRQFEQETLTRVAQARGWVAQAREAQNIAALGPAEAALRVGVARLFAVAERYPELKADRSFLALQGRIGELESAIADRREFYNDSANVNNIRIEQFPDLFVARAFGFREARMLNFDARDGDAVPIGALFVSDEGKAA